jgi:DNA-binding NarL/FixJ family response regulator
MPSPRAADLGAYEVAKPATIRAHGARVKARVKSGGKDRGNRMKSRVAIVDDHTLLADACRKLLEPDYDVVGTYSDPRAFLLDFPELRVDVVILDITMPLLNGLDTARELRKLNPELHIIILTMSEDPEIAAEAFRAGASGYVLKRCAGSELTIAVREVMQQRYYVTPLLTKGLVGAFVHDPTSRKPIYQLTQRQREVLQLLAEGRSMKEAGAILNVSARTVAFHKYRMMQQLHVTSTAALIQLAVREGLI